MSELPFWVWETLSRIRGNTEKPCVREGLMRRVGAAPRGPEVTSNVTLRAQLWEHLRGASAAALESRGPQRPQERIGLVCSWEKAGVWGCLGATESSQGQGPRGKGGLLWRLESMGAKDEAEGGSAPQPGVFWPRLGSIV